MTRTFTVMVIEENIVYRNNVREYIERNFSPVNVTECDSMKDVFKLLMKRPYDMVFLDYDSSEIKEANMVRRLSFQYPETAIILLTSHSNDESVRRALQEGASGIVVKNEALHDPEDRGWISGKKE